MAPKPKAPKAPTVILLDMAEHSVDDMYNGCREEMTQMVQTKYKEEIKQFEDLWNDAEECADRNALTKDHMQVICVYTSGFKNFYEKFNEAVRTGREQYGTSFPYHSFHFLLTIAIQLLKENQGCHMVYRRSELKFIGKVNQIIRFGSFTSCSFRNSITYFGEESCFKILTCCGASLKTYSHFDTEEEVLIPPYEKFKITESFKGTQVKYQTYMSDCKAVYILESTGVHSDLNCKTACV
ncbi:hypothetical protein LDENG_00207010 [Lucifuga dentata]|nr:hypothetical protein LDENG_00207010 [Lucifuga dentata]